MPLRPAPSVFRWVLVSSCLTAIGTIDFVHRWPRTEAATGANPIELTVLTVNIIRSSPLLLGIAACIATMVIVLIAQVITGPSGLNTPE